MRAYRTSLMTLIRLMTLAPIWVRHSGGPPFGGIIVIITLTLTPGSPEWRTSGMAGCYRRPRRLTLNCSLHGRTSLITVAGDVQSFTEPCCIASIIDTFSINDDGSLTRSYKNEQLHA